MATHSGPFCSLAKWLNSLFLIFLFPALCNAAAFRYGKYFWYNNSIPDSSDNTFYIYMPVPGEKTGLPKPVVYQFFGSGFLVSNLLAKGGPPFRSATPAIKDYVADGFAFVSTGYRLVDRQYFYNDTNGTVQPEELIHVAPDGRLSLDTKGHTMNDYQVQASFEERATKCLWDAVQSLEFLINNARSFDIDVNRIVLLGSSAGSLPLNYISWVYHQWHQERFHPVGMILAGPQFNHPVMPSLNLVWSSIMKHLEDGTTMKDVMPFGDCYRFIMCRSGAFGNARDPYNRTSDTCNKTWNLQAATRYCNNEAAYNATTLAQMNASQSWNLNVPEFGVGLQRIFNTGENMLRYQPKPFHVFAHPGQMLWEHYLHHPIFVEQFAEHADKVGINYTVYYQRYRRMRYLWPHVKNVVESDFLQGEAQVNYLSSTPWRNAYPEVKMADTGGIETFAQAAFNQYIAHRQFACMVTDMACSPVHRSRRKLTPAELWQQHIRLAWTQAGGSLALFGFFSLLMVTMIVCYARRTILASKESPSIFTRIATIESPRTDPGFETMRRNAPDASLLL